MEEQVCQLLEVRVQRQGQAHTLTKGEMLRSGDQFAVTVKLRAPRYLYVVKRANQRIAEILSPAQDAVKRSNESESVHVPTDGGWLKLGKGEDLCLLASKVRLDGGDEGASGKGDDDTTLSPTGPEQEAGPGNRGGAIEIIELPAGPGNGSSRSEPGGRSRHITAARSE